jgi:hypothetical protein
MARRRSFSIFSLSFLDVMSCGFGAVILIFLVMNHTTEEAEKRVNVDRLAEARLLDYQVLKGERELFELIERTEALKQRMSEAEQSLASSRAALERRKDDFSKLEAESIAQRENAARLQSDLETREKEVERLRAMEEANDGGRIRSFKGEGDRQYLTGMKVGGKRTVKVPKDFNKPVPGLELNRPTDVALTVEIELVANRNLPQQPRGRR